MRTKRAPSADSRGAGRRPGGGRARGRSAGRGRSRACRRSRRCRARSARRSARAPPPARPGRGRAPRWRHAVARDVDGASSGSPRGREAQRVVEQDAQDLRDAAGVGQRPDRPPARRAGARRPLRARAARTRPPPRARSRRADRLAAQRDAGVEAAEVEQRRPPAAQPLALRLGPRDLRRARRRGPARSLARSSSSRPSISRSDASGVRSSCDAVATNARRACSCSRSRCCIVAKARARSPTSSRGVVGRTSAAGPSAATRSAVSRSACSRRTSVVASRMPSEQRRSTKPTSGRDQQRPPHDARGRRRDASSERSQREPEAQRRPRDRERDVRLGVLRRTPAIVRGRVRAGARERVAVSGSRPRSRRSVARRARGPPRTTTPPRRRCGGAASGPALAAAPTRRAARRAAELARTSMRERLARPSRSERSASCAQPPVERREQRDRGHRERERARRRQRRDQPAVKPRGRAGGASLRARAAGSRRRAR